LVELGQLANAPGTWGSIAASFACALTPRLPSWESIGLLELPSTDTAALSHASSLVIAALALDSNCWSPEPGFSVASVLCAVRTVPIVVFAAAFARPGPPLTDSESSAPVSWLLSLKAGVNATRACATYDGPLRRSANSTIATTAAATTTRLATAAPKTNRRPRPPAADGSPAGGGANPPTV